MSCFCSASVSALSAAGLDVSLDARAIVGAVAGALPAGMAV